MYDLLIIGSGPAGLSAAVYGLRAGLNLAVIEKMFQGMGQITQSSQVDNYLGVPGIDGFSIGMKFREHAESMGTNFIEEEVAAIELSDTSSDKYWKLKTTSGKIYESKTIILATGATHKKLSIPGESEYEGRGVSYCATCDGAFYRNKTVAVNGGGDTALDDAIYLSNICKKVYLIHRRDSFRAAKKTIQHVIDKENIELILESEITEILGNDLVTGINIKNKKTEENHLLEIDGLFIAIGSKPLSTMVPVDIDLDASGYVISDESCTTKLPGFYVAGDVRTKSLRQVITAVSDGAIAATAATEYLTN